MFCRVEARERTNTVILEVCQRPSVLLLKPKARDPAIQREDVDDFDVHKHQKVADESVDSRAYIEMSRGPTAKDFPRRPEVLMKIVPFRSAGVSSIVGKHRHKLAEAQPERGWRSLSLVLDAVVNELWNTLYRSRGPGKIKSEQISSLQHLLYRNNQCDLKESPAAGSMTEDSDRDSPGSHPRVHRRFGDSSCPTTPPTN